MARRGRPGRTRQRIEVGVGTRIRSLREERALTQAALARLAGTSQSNLARIEAGERSPTIGSLAKIARALRVDLATLVDGLVPAPKPVAAEKRWFRLCERLRDADESFLRAVEHLVRALEAIQYP